MGRSKNPERIFIHDISNQLTIAVGMVEVVLTTLEGAKDLDPKVNERLMKSLKAMERISDLCKARREVLIAQEAESSSEDGN